MNRLLGAAGAILLLGAMLAGPLGAAEPEVREDAPDTYEVVRGDTLWDIAGRFLELPWLWPQVWEVNPQIENPHLIYPGDVIRLTYQDGMPVLSLERGGVGAAALGADVPGDLPTVRLTPQVRREELRSPIPAIPLAAINSFLEGKRVIASSEVADTPYYLGTQKGTLLAAPGDVIYARGNWPGDVSTFEIVRPGAMFVDPVTREEIGIRAERIGEAALLTRDGDKATLRVTGVSEEIRMGDRLMPRPANIVDATFFPEPPASQIDARILEIGEGVAYGGQWDTLILNAGEREGLMPGHLLTVQKPDALVPDRSTGETLIFPGEKYASVLVYRVFERASLALVLSSEGPIRMDDRLVTP